MLINNAAQTIRRPRAYYREVLEREQQIASGKHNFKFMIKNPGKNPFLLKNEKGILFSHCIISQR